MKNKPKIRFAGYTDDWKQRKLGNIMSTVTDYVAAGSFAELRKNVTYRSETNYAQLIRTVDLKKKFTNNDFVYVDGNAFEYLWRVNLDEECIVLPNIGANIGEVYYVQPSDLPHENNVLGPNAILLKTNEDNYFVFTTLNTALFQKKLFENVGASGQPKFNKTELKSITLEMPSLEEQKQIGEYFSHLDNLITFHLRKLDSLKQCKKYMLSKMFPKNGETVPEIRFEGFTGDWERRKFSELYAKSSEKNDGSIGMDRNITVATMQFKDDVKVSTLEYLKTYYTFNLGDIAFEGHQSKEFRFGRFVENDIGNGIVSHIFTVFRPIIEFDLQFWKYAINNEMLMQQILSRSTKASTMMHDLVTDDFLNETFLVPSLDEQKQIGACLYSLDHLITLHQHKLDSLKQFKNYMLQNMFPSAD